MKILEIFTGLATHNTRTRGREREIYRDGRIDRHTLRREREREMAIKQS